MTQVDLNLLLALDALLEENSVAAAAQRLHLSSPAVSRTLSRIRDATGDDILVRNGRTMAPTPYATAIRDEVRAVVQQARALLRPERALDLASLERVFSIRGHDLLLTAVAPELTASAVRKAPNVQIRFLPEGSGESLELARGQVDLELGADHPGSPAILAEKLGTDRLVVALRAGHPLAKGTLTTKRFASATHVTVSRRGRLRGRIDDSLASAGFQRRVVASFATSIAALELVARTDHVAVVPETFCRPLCAALGLVSRPTPFDLPPSDVIVAWHRRYDGDAAHVWLRAEVRDALRRWFTAEAKVPRRSRAQRRAMGG